MNRVFYGYPHKSMIPLPTSIKVVPLIIALIFSVACSELFAQSSAPPKSAKPTLPLGSALDRPVAAKPAGSSLDRTPAAKLPESLSRKPSSLGSFSDAKGMSFEAKSISNGTSEQPETAGTFWPKMWEVVTPMSGIKTGTISPFFLALSPKNLLSPKTL